MLSRAHGRAAGQNQGRPELADIFRHYGERYRKTHCLPAAHRKVMRAIEVCRTAELGGHLKQCDTCGFEHPSYNSCRNRHCPKCQSLAKAKWLEKQTAELLPVGYFHLVFTLPHELNRLILANKKILLALLFKAVSETLLEFGRRPVLSGTLGIIAVLHTWDQTLKDHFHLHCLVPAGALSLDHSRWIEARRNFLFPVKALSRVFRGKFLALLQQAREKGKIPAATNEIKASRQKSWVVYAKKPFGSPQTVLDYLGRYTHRVALSNDRILAVAKRPGHLELSRLAKTGIEKRRWPSRPTNSSAASCSTSCPTASCASVTSAFWPTEPKNTLSLNAESSWGLVPPCPSSLKNQPTTFCVNLPASIFPAAPLARTEH